MSSENVPFHPEPPRERHVERLVRPLEQLARREVVDGRGRLRRHGRGAGRRSRRVGRGRRAPTRRERDDRRAPRRQGPRSGASTPGTTPHSTTDAHESITVGESGVGTERLIDCVPIPLVLGAPTCEEIA